MKTPDKCKTCVMLHTMTNGKKHCCWMGIGGKSIQSCHSHCKLNGYEGFKEKTQQ